MEYYFSATVNFSITSAKSKEDLKSLVEAYINEACSKLENEGLELTYRLNMKEFIY